MKRFHLFFGKTHYNDYKDYRGSFESLAEARTQCAWANGHDTQDAAIYETREDGSLALIEVCNSWDWDDPSVPRWHSPDIA